MVAKKTMTLFFVPAYALVSLELKFILNFRFLKVRNTSLLDKPYPRRMAFNLGFFLTSLLFDWRSRRSMRGCC